MNEWWKWMRKGRGRKFSLSFIKRGENRIKVDGDVL
jgi:hypothetical protein